MSPTASKVGNRRLHTWIHRTLLVGVVCSLILLLLGLILWGIADAEGELLEVSLDQVLPQILNFSPSGIISLGILMLLATPVLRVLVGLFAFWIQGDRRYAILSLFILLLLFASLTVAILLH